MSAKKKIKFQKKLIIFFKDIQKKSHHIPVMVHVIFITALILGILVILLFNQGSFNIIKNGKVNSEKIVDKDVRYNVFGDHFVNDLSINNNQTTFYYDRATTAFTFAPLYTVVDSGGGVSEILQPEEMVFVEGSLLYKGKKIALPTDLKKAEILNVSSYKLSKDLLVGFVFNLDKKESGRAYRFNGRTFTNLDVKNSIPLDSRNGFPGASFGFGGDDNNFLVLYGGYDLLGYQVVNGKLIDLRQFFSLRLSDGGFAPLIIQQKRSNETLWYVCSKSAGEPRFIKFWQNSSSSIKGALSFTNIIFGDKGLVDSAWCKTGGALGEIEINVQQGESYSKKTFQDNGFEQNKNYVLVTTNLFKDAGEILKANFNSFLACDNKICGPGVLNNSLHFSVSGEGNEFKEASLGKDFIFPNFSKGLYWKITADNQNNGIDYSPWIDGLTAISYSWK